MPKAIGPGVLLKCILTVTEQEADRPQRVFAGSYYMCEAVHESDELCLRDQCGFTGILLRGIPDWVDGLGLVWTPLFCPARFVPVDDGDTSLVEAEKGDLTADWLKTLSDELEDA